jgi:hypothetical protein
LTVGMRIQMYVKYNNVGTVLDVAHQIPIAERHSVKLEHRKSSAVCRRTGRGDEHWPNEDWRRYSYLEYAAICWVGRHNGSHGSHGLGFGNRI